MFLKEVLTPLAKERDRFQIISQWAVRPRDLIQALMFHQPNVVHFIGHGTGSQGLMLDDGRGCAQRVPNKALARLFRQLTSVECVLLNACYSDMQAQSASQLVPCVIGTNQEISDPAAISFSSGFYTALGHGSTYETAYER